VAAAKAHAPGAADPLSDASRAPRAPHDPVARPRRIAAVLAVLVLAALAAGGYVVWHRAGHSTPVRVSAAVRAFRAAGSALAGHPAPGVYAYAVSGYECAGIGPVCVHRRLPHRGYEIITRRGRTLTIELDLSAQHSETQRFGLTRAGRMLEWQRTDLSILGVTQDDATATIPATLALPARLRPGVRWTQTFHAEAVRVHGRNTILPARTVTVAGDRERCLTVVADSVTTGPHPGTERDRDCIVPGSLLDVRFSIDRRITGTFPYRLELTAALVSPTPQR
jgi:hypothetical protein